MKIRISEVWNRVGKSKELAVIESDNLLGPSAVRKWIRENRPDLTVAESIYAHGYHAVEVK